MLDLLNQYSIQNIIIFIIFLALAVRGSVSFFDWARDRVKKAIFHSDIPNQLKDNIQDHSKSIEELQESIAEIRDLVSLLIQSDKDAIKAYITKQHHCFVYQRGWIDDYSLNCIEQRYNHYKDEGGNSFIGTLMQELRKLPKQPFEDNEFKKEDLNESKNN